MSQQSSHSHTRNLSKPSRCSHWPWPFCPKATANGHSNTQRTVTMVNELLPEDDQRHPTPQVLQQHVYGTGSSAPRIGCYARDPYPPKSKQIPDPKIVNNLPTPMYPTPSHSTRCFHVMLRPATSQHSTVKHCPVHPIHAPARLGPAGNAPTQRHAQLRDASTRRHTQACSCVCRPPHWHAPRHAPYRSQVDQPRVAGREHS